MNQARKQAMVIAVTVALTIACARDQLAGHVRVRRDGERGATSLEWAIIAALAAGFAAFVGVKVNSAINAHAQNIK